LSNIPIVTVSGTGLEQLIVHLGDEQMVFAVGSDRAKRQVVVMRDDLDHLLAAWVLLPTPI